MFVNILLLLLLSVMRFLLLGKILPRQYLTFIVNLYMRDSVFGYSGFSKHLTSFPLKSAAYLLALHVMCSYTSLILILVACMCLLAL